VGIADEQGYGWAIAKALAEAGAEPVLAAAWVPAHNVLLKRLQRGKMDSARELRDGTTLDFAHIYPVDVAYDTMEVSVHQRALDRRDSPFFNGVRVILFSAVTGRSKIFLDPRHHPDTGRP
jgi:enoyl-[acyl-carrier protein] reductase I